MLCEVFGQVSRERSAKISVAIKSALEFTKQRQSEPIKQSPLDEGGWRYLYHVAPLAVRKVTIGSACACRS